MTDPDPRLDEVVVDEGDHAVTVTASIIETESEGRMCAGVGFDVRVPVELKRSLGGRKILDGSCSPPAQVIGVDEQREPCAQTELKKAQEGAIGKWERFDAGPSPAAAASPRRCGPARRCSSSVVLSKVAR